MPTTENQRALKALLKRHDLRAVIPKNTLANHLRGQAPRGFWLVLYDRLGLRPEGWLTTPQRKKLDRVVDRIDKATKAKAETIQPK